MNSKEHRELLDSLREYSREAKRESLVIRSAMNMISHLDYVLSEVLKCVSGDIVIKSYPGIEKVDSKDLVERYENLVLIHNGERIERD